MAILFDLEEGERLRLFEIEIKEFPRVCLRYVPKERFKKTLNFQEIKIGDFGRNLVYVYDDIFK